MALRQPHSVVIHPYPTYTMCTRILSYSFYTVDQHLIPASLQNTRTSSLRLTEHPHLIVLALIVCLGLLEVTPHFLHLFVLLTQQLLLLDVHLIAQLQLQTPSLQCQTIRTHREHTPHAYVMRSYQAVSARWKTFEW